jgi:hypothetical protein
MYVRVLLACGLTAAGLILTGCDGSGPDRHEVTGYVTYRGTPVDEGVIDFEPQDSQGSRDGATIHNGAYRIPRDKGLFAGRYKVSIVIGDGRASATNAGADTPAQKKKGAPGRVAERAPPEFNTRSTLIREVTRDGTNTFDFAIP